MLSGNWKSFEELEDHLTLDQLMKMIEKGREKEDRLHKIILASVGINLGDEEEANDIIDDIEKGGVIDDDGRYLDFGIGYEVE